MKIWNHRFFGWFMRHKDLILGITVVQKIQIASCRVFYPFCVWYSKLLWGSLLACPDWPLSIAFSVSIVVVVYCFPLFCCLFFLGFQSNLCEFLWIIFYFRFPWIGASAKFRYVVKYSAKVVLDFLHIYLQIWLPKKGLFPNGDLNSAKLKFQFSFKKTSSSLSSC